MVHKTNDEENYSGIIEDGFEAYNVAFDEIVSFVKENREKKLDLMIRFEDFLVVKMQLSTVLENLCGLELPEKSLILRLPIGLTHFEDEDLSGKYPFSEFEQSKQVKLSFIYKIVLPPTFNQLIRFEKKGITLVVPSTLNYVVGQDFSSGEALWSNGKNGYETYPVEQKFVELNEYAFVFDNIASSYESDFDTKNFSSPMATPVACVPQPYRAKAAIRDHILCGKLSREINRDNKVTKEEKNAIFTAEQERRKIEAAVFAPPAIGVNKTFFIQVAIYQHKDFIEIKTKHGLFKDMSKLHKNKTVRLKIPKKANISIKLTLKDPKNKFVLEKEYSTKWENISIEKDFDTKIPEMPSERQVLGNVEILINGKSSCEMQFAIIVFPEFSEALNSIKGFLNSPLGKTIMAVVVYTVTDGLDVTGILT